MLGFYSIDMLYCATYPHIRTPVSSPGKKDLVVPPTPKKAKYATPDTPTEAGQSGIIECLNCNQEGQASDMHFCSKMECCFYACGECAEDHLFQCDTCGDMACSDCWYDAGDEMSTDPCELGASSCLECQEM
ncbi:MAG: hypothetical protein CMF24_08645 [Ilumatobacter sp.]|nr:hypothetical protein [Ilumatobacter sp.]|tara:strand:- start:1477 stop:1872 length:396 start_codon:yes stop_codon:yes gene_type:complete